MGRPRNLRLTATDEANLEWRANDADAAVGCVRAAGYDPRGGTCSPVTHDHVTDAQLRARRRCRGVDEILGRLSAEHRQALLAYWGPISARARVEVERSGKKPVAGVALRSTLRAISASGTASETAEMRGLRLLALYPSTPAAIARGRERAAVMAAPEHGRRMATLAIAGAQVDAERSARWGGDAEDIAAVHRPLTSIDVLVRVLDEDIRRVEMAQACAAPPAVLLEHGDLRDAALGALRHAEAVGDKAFLSLVQREAARLYSNAGEAYVESRRASRGLDDEEKRAEAAARWQQEQRAVSLAVRARALRESSEDGPGAQAAE